MEIILRPLKDLRPHEQVNSGHVVQIMEDIRSEQAVKRPLIVAKGCQTLLDGHHRYNALRKLGAKYAPCIEVNYNNTEEIEVMSWRIHEVVTIRAVRRAASCGPLMPPKTSKHVLKFSVPPIWLPLEDLLSDIATVSGNITSNVLENTQ